MRFARVRIVAAAALVVVGAHSQTATPVVPIPVTEQRNTAVGFALTQAQFVSSMLATCAKLDSSAQERSRAAWAAWRSRNWPYVDASMGWVQYVRATIAARQGPEAASKLEPAILADVRANAHKQLLEFLPTGQPDTTVCDRWIALTTDAVSDLRNEKEFGGELETILVFHRAVLNQAPRR